MKDPTAAQRKAAERQRLRAQGLRPMEVWVYPQHKQAVKEYVKKLASLNGYWQDAAGTIPVTEFGQRVGRIDEPAHIRE